MKKNFKYFSITWLVCFVLFNAITFLIPNDVFGITRFDKSVFWVAYALITLSFIVQLITAYKFIKNDGNEERFLNIPLLKVGYSAIIVSVLVGLIFMIFPVLPTWVGAIVCLLVAGCFVITCINVASIANGVTDVVVKVKNKTAFIYEMRELSESLLARAKTDERKAICKKVRDAFKYSDPMSNALFTTVEEEIKTHFDLLKKAVTEENAATVAFEAEEVLALIAERNNKCKRLK